MSKAARPAKPAKPPLPSAGGSYTVTEDGTLEQVVAPPKRADAAQKSEG